MYVCIYIYKYIYIYYVCVCKYIHMYICMYIHTYTCRQQGWTTLRQCNSDNRLNRCFPSRELKQRYGSDLSDMAAPVQMMRTSTRSAQDREQYKQVRWQHLMSQMSAAPVTRSPNPSVRPDSGAPGTVGALGRCMYP